jgi:hypothetical protein
LADLQKALGSAVQNAALSKNPDRRGIRVALLSKRALHDPTDIVEFSPNVAFAIGDQRGNPITTLRRGALWAKAKLAGIIVHVITAHLKSKLLDYPTPDGGTAFSTNDEALRVAPRASHSRNAPRGRDTPNLSQPHPRDQPERRPHSAR